jgi:hypothetical protein
MGRVTPIPKYNGRARTMVIEAEPFDCPQKEKR